MITLFGSNVWANALYMLTFLLLGGILSPIEFGSFRVALAYISIAVSIAMLGLNTSVTHQFPLFSEPQRFRSWELIKKIVVVAAVFLGLLVYLLMPNAGIAEDYLQQIFYIVSFPVAVAGASLCNILMSINQSSGNLKAYARLQIEWKTLLFICGMLGGFLLQAQTVLIAMSLSYVGVYILQYKNILDLKTESLKLAIDRTDVIKPLFKNSIWPFASICVSVIYSNIEFLYIDADHIKSGVAGAYSLASLIFIGGAAFFTPLQTYAGSMVVNRKMALSGLLKLQLICFAAVCLISLFALAIAYIMMKIDQYKFNDIFFQFAVLVCIKLALWGSYAVVGSVLFYLDKGFESFLLTLLCLAGIFSATLLIGEINTLQDMVVLQIASGFILLLGSMYLVVDGCRGRSVNMM